MNTKNYEHRTENEKRLLEQERSTRTCEFEYCGQRKLMDQGMFSRTLEDVPDKYIPWFCSELCCNMRKYQEGRSSPLSNQLYFYALSNVYRRKVDSTPSDQVNKN